MIHKGLSFKEYSKLEGLSQSALKNILKTPAIFKAHMEGKIRVESESLSLGRLIHLALLFPASWNTMIKVYEGTRRGKAWEEFKQELNGALAVTEKEFEKLNEFLSSVKDDEYLNSFLKGEHEIALTGELCSLKVKGQIDSYMEGQIIDIKTTRDASPDEFSKSILNYGYHIQAAMYLHLCEVNNLEAHSFKFIAMETEYPYQYAVYELAPEAIALGFSELKRAIEIYKDCRDKKDFPSYPKCVKEISIPHWGI